MYAAAVNALMLTRYVRETEEDRNSEYYRVICWKLPPGGGSPGGLGDQAAPDGSGDGLHASHGVHANGRGPDALPVPGI